MRRFLTAVMTATFLAGILPLPASAAGSTPQAITFDALANKTYGDAAFPVSANTDSKLEITFTSLTTGACTVVPDTYDIATGVTTGTVSIAGHGTCTIEATQDGDTVYAAAAPQDRDFTVALATQTVTAVDKAITYGDPDPAFTFVYGAWQYSDTPAVVTTPPTCDASGAHTGVLGSPYTITCSGAAADDYTFSYGDGTLTINKAAPSFSISVPSTAYDGSTHGAAGFAYGVGGIGDVLTPAVTFSYQGTSGTTYGPSSTAPTNAGTYRLTVSFAGNGNYLSGSTTATITIGRASPNCTVTGYTVTYDGAMHTATGSCSGAGGATLAVPSMSGTTHTNAATYATDPWTFTDISGNYNDASGTVSDVISKADQTVVFTDNPTPVHKDQTYTPIAKATSGLTVAITVDAASNGACTIDELGVVTFTAAPGACVLDATQGGDANWNVAPQAQMEIGIGDQKPGCAPDATLDVVMNVAASGPANCTDPDGNPLTFAIGRNGANGTATIDASGQWTYTPRSNVVPSSKTSVTDSFTVVANDGLVDSDPAIISVTISNHPVSGSLEIEHVRVVVPTAIDVLAQVGPGAGDTGQPLTITAVTQGTSGRVTTDGHTVTYDPNVCSTATDAFRIHGERRSDIGRRPGCRVGGQAGPERPALHPGHEHPGPRLHHRLHDQQRDPDEAELVRRSGSLDEPVRLPDRPEHQRRLKLDLDLGLIDRRHVEDAQPEHLVPLPVGRANDGQEGGHGPHAAGVRHLARVPGHPHPGELHVGDQLPRDVACQQDLRLLGGVGALRDVLQRDGGVQDGHQRPWDRDRCLPRPDPRQHAHLRRRRAGGHRLPASLGRPVPARALCPRLDRRRVAHRPHQALRQRPHRPRRDSHPPVRRPGNGRLGGRGALVSSPAR